VLIRLNQVMRGWADYFRHAVAKHTFGMLENFAWRRVIRMVMARRHWTWTDVRRRLVTPTGRWRRPEADGIDLFNVATVYCRRYRHRGNTIPSPWPCPTTPERQTPWREPIAERSARRVRRAAWGNCSRTAPSRVCAGTRCTASTAAHRTNRLPCLVIGSGHGAPWCRTRGLSGSTLPSRLGRVPWIMGRGRVARS
jgi:hypothetical protein